MLFALILASTLYACKGNRSQNATQDTDSTKVAEVSVEMKSPPLVVDSPTVLSYTFKQNGKEADLEVFHEKKLHVILVSEDLSWFQHVHSDSNSYNPYKVGVQFPSVGNYFIYADYKPKGAEVQNYKHAVMVHGTKQRVADEI